MRSRGQLTKASVIVGKDGLTESVVSELDRQLKKAKLVKVKLLQTPHEGMQAFAASISEAARGELVETRGKTVLVYREH